jgi:hypothetical protein
MTQTILTAGDLSNGTSLLSGNDGTVVIQSGLAGAKVNALSFAIDGTPTFLKGPVASQIILVGNSGYGSTNTQVRRWTTVASTQGSDITYTDSATLGGQFTINTSGVYAIQYNDQSNATNSGLAITLNSQVTFSSGSTTQPATVATAGANITSCVGTTLYLPSGTTVRAIMTAPAGATPNYTTFSIVRVA